MSPQAFAAVVIDVSRPSYFGGKCLNMFLILLQLLNVLVGGEGEILAVRAAQKQFLGGTIRP